MDIGALILLLVVLVIYLIPYSVAKSRRHRSKGAILAVNLLLGWTFIGWVVALVWANTGNVERDDPNAPTPETHVKCPDCRELVLRDARKCKHCGCALVPQ